MGIINLIFSPFGLSDCPVGILLGSHVVTPRFTSSLFGVEWKRGRISPFTLALDVTEDQLGAPTLSKPILLPGWPGWGHRLSLGSWRWVLPGHMA